MKNIHAMHLEPDYFDLVKTGQKNIEFRLFDEKRQNIKIGDKIKFICQTNNNLTFTRTVQNLQFSSSFSLLLEVFSEYQASADAKEMLTKLQKIYNRMDEEKYGVIAICLGE